MLNLHLVVSISCILRRLGLLLGIHLIRAALVVAIKELDTERQRLIWASFVYRLWLPHSCISIVVWVYIRLILSRANTSFGCRNILAFNQVTLVVKNICTHLAWEQWRFIAISVLLNIATFLIRGRWRTFNLCGIHLSLAHSCRLLLISRRGSNTLEEASWWAALHVNQLFPIALMTRAASSLLDHLFALKSGEWPLLLLLLLLVLVLLGHGQWWVHSRSRWTWVYQSNVVQTNNWVEFVWWLLDR